MQLSNRRASSARIAIAGVLVGIGSLIVGACTPPAPAPLPSSTNISIRDQWTLSAGSGSMSAALGVLVNSSNRAITVVAATSDVSPTMELHETVPNGSGGTTMQPKPGGFKIPAGGEYVLQPGGDHLMLMRLIRTVRAGENITVTLTFDDGSTMQFTAPARNFTWPM